jgi:hypothetical protein
MELENGLKRKKISKKKRDIKIIKKKRRKAIR